MKIKILQTNTIQQSFDNAIHIDFKHDTLTVEYIDDKGSLRSYINPMGYIIAFNCDKT